MAAQAWPRVFPVRVRVWVWRAPGSAPLLLWLPPGRMHLAPTWRSPQGLLVALLARRLLTVVLQMRRWFGPVFAMSGLCPLWQPPGLGAMGV